MQLICKCGCKNFSIVAEIHFDNDSVGGYANQNSYKYQCIKCQTLHDQKGNELE